MPLFFAISGVFATNAVQRPWRRVARGRIAKFLYLYAVWLLIHTAVLAAAPDFPTDRATSVWGLLEQLTITPSNLWYLYALALYFAFAKAVRRLPRLVVVMPAAATSSTCRCWRCCTGCWSGRCPHSAAAPKCWSRSAIRC